MLGGGIRLRCTYGGVATSPTVLDVNDIWWDGSGDTVPGHAFISYVHEDEADVDRLQRALEAAGVKVWRDTEKLWPGDDWKQRIRDAITRDSLVFLACFSASSIAKSKSYQNEELLLAVDEFRLRSPGGSWLIPVRFSGCDLPHYDLGANRSLDAIQRVDLYDEHWDSGIARLTAVVLRAFADLDRSAGRPPAPTVPAPTDPTSFVKSALLDSARQIELDDFVMEQANVAARAFKDREQFPVQTNELTSDLAGIRYLAHQVDQYWDVLEPFLSALVPGCAWGRSEHEELWCRATRRVVNASRERSGSVALVRLQRFPVLPVLYAAGLASVHRRNWAALRAVAIDATLVDDDRGEIPLVGAAHPWRAFENSELLANLVAFEADGVEVDDQMLGDLSSGRKGKRHTPISDHLHSRLRPALSGLIPADDEYTATFDRLEVMLGALATDAKGQAHQAGIYLDGAWFGSFTWRYRYHSAGIEQTVLSEARSDGAKWGPVQGGLFGGDTGRAIAAMEKFAEEAGEARRRRF